MNNLDRFENIVKEKLQQQQYDYDPSQWNAIEKRLPSPKKGLPWRSIAAASTIVVASIVVWQIQKGKETAKNETDYQIRVISETELKSNSIQSKDGAQLSTVDKKNKTIIVEDRAYIQPIGDPNISNSTSSSDVLKEDGSEFDQNNRTEKLDDSELTSENVVTDDVIAASDLQNIKRPSAQFTLDKTTICAGDNIEFVLMQKSTNTHYLWDFGNGKSSSEHSPVFRYSQPGTYYVQLRATSALDASVVNVSDKIAIKVQPRPESNFNWSENSMNAIPTIQFEVNSETATNWEWNFDNGMTSNKKKPVVTFRKKGFYNVKLTTVNTEGCAKISQQQLEISTDYNLLAPNSFTPNADGINDDFIPKALDILNVNFEMSIFDKRGLIYSTKSVSYPWTGSNQRDGGVCPQGAYVWTVKYKDHDGIDQIYKGTINLLK
jgi:gliding motility-associated-like protein